MLVKNRGRARQLLGTESQAQGQTGLQSVVRRICQDNQPHSP
jgi:hypothetical protein